MWLCVCPAADWLSGLMKGVHIEDKDKPPSRLDSLTLEGIARYILSDKCKKIVIMAGAGISTCQCNQVSLLIESLGLKHSLEQYCYPCYTHETLHMPNFQTMILTFTHKIDKVCHFNLYFFIYKHYFYCSCRDPGFPDSWDRSLWQPGEVQSSKPSGRLHHWLLQGDCLF